MYRVGVPIVDITSGIVCALGVVPPGRARAQAAGPSVSTSLLETALGLRSSRGQRALSLGETPVPQGNNHPTIARTAVRDRHRAGHDRGRERPAVDGRSAASLVIPEKGQWTIRDSTLGAPTCSSISGRAQGADRDCAQRAVRQRVGPNHHGQRASRAGPDQLLLAGVRVASGLRLGPLRQGTRRYGTALPYGADP